MSKPQAHRNSFEKSHNRSNSKNTIRRPNATEKSNGSTDKINNSGSNGNANASTEVLQDETFQAHQHDRVLFLIMNSIGAEIVITTNDGGSKSGILESIDPKYLKIVLKTEGKVQTINFDDVVDFEIVNVDLFNNSFTKKAAAGFKTDTDISNRATSTQRRQEVEKWVPDASIPMGTSLEGLSLEDDSGAQWDQFATNEKKFGIKSEYDEHFYTTRINKNDPDYQKRLKEADRLAREIEGGITDNHHLAEERGIVLDDSGLDEEDKYSGVARKPSTAKGDALFASLINKGQDNKNLIFESQSKGSKYVPPSQRGRLQNLDPSIVSASKVSGKQPSPSPASVPAPAPTQATQAAQTAAQAPAASALTSAAKEPVPAPAASASTSVAKAPTASITAASAASKSTLPAKPVSVPTASKPLVPGAEKNRAFENVKKLNNMKEINSLKEFSQTFKIPAKFPEDLLPIVTKDKHKQEEILKKADAESAKASAKSSPKVDAPKTVTDTKTTPDVPTPQSKTSTRTNTPAATPTAPTAQLKRGDTKHKLNPKAMAFTPSFTPSNFGSPNPVVPTPQFSPHIPKNSPRLAHTPQRKRSAATFFAQGRAPSAEKKRSLGEDFNFFHGAEAEFKANKPDGKFYLERPFVTAPIWSDEEKPFKSLFPDPESIRSSVPSMHPHQMAPYQPIPMMQSPQMFYGAPQFPNMRMSPQQPQPMLSPSDPNFIQAQRMQPMYMQPGGIPMNPGAPMPYQRYPQGAGYPGPGGPMPQMIPPHSGGRMGYKNH
ncbi:CYFA0S01e17898g1_1 [Cyberlindnera fabianii]|uniref:CYFA0S01e17898g1_1 n=1 Tax=Cyberlindnera fabianii TaxID=36022 RepID=A0A061AR25_CYBFA|nr:CYFA0S01e17898g1_1 [Cyberlindnera fabianii]